jgi:hypothetical protein
MMSDNRIIIQNGRLRKILCGRWEDFCEIGLNFGAWLQFPKPKSRRCKKGQAQNEPALFVMSLRVKRRLGRFPFSD